MIAFSRLPKDAIRCAIIRKNVVDPHSAVSKPDRRRADLLGVPWDRVEVAFGDSGRHLPWTCISGGSQTTHAMTRAAHAAAMDARRKLQDIAAQTLGGTAASYQIAGGRAESWRSDPRAFDALI
jgi:CO/xanthine dehydrogenase Mo-binding subunit